MSVKILIAICFSIMLICNIVIFSLKQPKKMTQAQFKVVRYASVIVGVLVIVVFVILLKIGFFSA